MVTSGDTRAVLRVEASERNTAKGGVGVIAAWLSALWVNVRQDVPNFRFSTFCQLFEGMVVEYQVCTGRQIRSSPHGLPCS